MSADANPCDHCGKPTPPHQRACSWDCIVAGARAGGAREHLPNGLPARCVRFDGLLTECEGGDHRTYLFPVEAEKIGAAPDDEYATETHALIYTDGCVAVTLYECCYYSWHPRQEGECFGAPSWTERKEWRLSAASCAAIAEHTAKQPPNPLDPEPRR